MAAPKIELRSLRKVFGDGLHNAFTDLCEFGGKFYLAFRSCPDGHPVHSSSAIRVFSSPDGNEWAEVFTFSVADRDTRDPHFLVFKETLFVYTGTWLCPEEKAERDINQHLGYCAWTQDGTAWDGPRMLEGTYGHYIWRAATSGSRAYLCGRRKRTFQHGIAHSEGGNLTQAVLLESDDGFVWRFRSVYREEYGDETAFMFARDGELIGLARSLAGKNACVCRSQPPHEVWTRTELDRYVGGPMLVNWQGHLLAGGRKTLGGSPAVTTLYWLENDQLTEIMELPSGGDNSYTGFVEIEPGRALVSYYSSHEGTRPNESSIYLAELQMSPGS